MQFVSVAVPGGIERMELAELALPEPGPAEARVRIEAAGVNFIDVYHRTGRYPMAGGLKLGLEGAGRVEAIGPNVRDLTVGQRVAWANVPGSYATHVNAPADKLVPVPDALGPQQACAAMLQGMTAHFLTRSIAPLRGGEHCLVHAAAGGLGLLLCQMARAVGAHAIGTTSTPEKAEMARAAGAEHVILYKEQDFVAEVRRLTGGVGVSVVYDSVGKTTFTGSLDCLKTRGTLILLGQSSGPAPAIDPQVLGQKGSLFLTRPSLVAYTAERTELLWRAHEVLNAVAEGRLILKIHAALPLAEVQKAHALLEGRETSGKLVLLPAA